MRLEELIVRHCAPTLAGLKTGNLFSCQTEDEEKLLADIRRVNRQFASRGIRLIPMEYREGRALIYMYRPQKLKKDLSDKTARRLLAAQNYPVSQESQCVAYLIRRLEIGTVFPHEIGLFLGYPPEDVEAFMKHGAAGAKYTGIWKVYGNVEAAKCKFARFKKCARVYDEDFRKYHSLDRLIVSCS